MGGTFLTIGGLILIASIFISTIPVFTKDKRWHVTCFFMNVSCTLYAIGMSMIFMWIAAYMMSSI